MGTDVTMERDLHCHTFFSPCADPSMSFAAIVDAAEKAGLKEIGLTDHPHRPGLAKHHQLLERARAECRSPVRVWIGAELEVAGLERLVIPPPELPLADYLIAAPSHYDLEHYPPVQCLDDPMAWADRMMTDMENVPRSGAHCMAHPFFTYPIVVRPPAGMDLPLIKDIFAEIRPKRLDHLLERLAATNIALEISPRICCTAIFEAFLEDMYRRAKRIGCMFYTGGDAHRLDAVGRLHKAADFIRRLELGPANFWSPSMIQEGGRK